MYPYQIEREVFPIKETNQNNQELTFAEQVDNVLTGHSSRYNDLKVCDTPKILLDVGCKQLPMFYTQKHLRDALRTKGNKGESIHHHGLKPEQVKKIPELINNPVIIYDSLSRNDSLVIVTSEMDEDHSPIIVAIRPNGTANYEMNIVDSNFILSIHGRNNFEKQMRKALNQDKILFFNKQKSQDLFSVLGLQLSQGFNNLDSDIIIHQSENIINSNLQINSKFFEKDTSVFRRNAVEQYKDSIQNIIEYHELQNKGWQLTHEFAAKCIYTHNTDALLAVLYKNVQMQPNSLQEEFLNLYNNLEKAIKELDSTEYSPENAEAVAAITSENHPASITDVSMQETLTIDVNTTITSYDMAYLPIAFVPDMELKQEIEAALTELVTEKIELDNKNMQHPKAEAPETEKTLAPPTKKQINFANRIVETLGVELQAQTKAEYQQFIKENLNAYQDARQHPEAEASGTEKTLDAPTEKQVNFANTIAKSLGVELPAQTKAEYQQFISENVDAYRDTLQPAPQAVQQSNAPTQKQIDFANKIVAILGIELTAQTRADYQKFIDANKEIYRNFEKMPTQSRPYTKTLNECLTGWKWEHQADGSGRLVMPDGQEYGKYDLNSQEYTITHEQQEQEWTEASSPIKKLELSAIRFQLNINSIDSQDISTLQCIDEVAASLEAADVSDMTLNEGTPDLDGGGFEGF